MAYITEIEIIKRKILTLLSQKMFEGTLREDIRDISEKITPDSAQPFRCCVYHDREITNDRIKTLLNLEYEKYKNVSWAKTYESFMTGEIDDLPPLSILDEACNGCPQQRYYVTEACQHCLAHPCALNCPKDAISIEDDRAKIDEDECVECGLCVKNCPFNAIIQVNRPCENACPVEAIQTDEEGIARINYERCILCGRCLTSCPFGAIVEKSDMLTVIKKLTGGKKLTALLAPSIVGQFSVKATVPELTTALKEIGFDKVYELASYAARTAEKEAVELEENDGVLLSSCCPSWVSYIEKITPEFVENISKTASPMRAAGEDKKAGETLVFIGPCISKKQEAETTDIDYVLTYEELASMLTAKDIDVSTCPETDPDMAGDYRGWLFAQSGGLTESLQNFLSEPGDFEIDKIDGIENKLAAKLKRMAKKADFIEGMGCENGCLGGPCIITNPRITKRKLTDFIEKISAKSDI